MQFIEILVVLPSFYNSSAALFSFLTLCLFQNCRQDKNTVLILNRTRMGVLGPRRELSVWPLSLCGLAEQNWAIQSSVLSPALWQRFKISITRLQFPIALQLFLLENKKA